MTDGPTRPVSFEKARRKIWERLAANANIDLKQHLSSADEQPTSEAGRQINEHLEALWSDADIRLLGLIIVEELGAWVASGGDWKAPTQETLRAKFGRDADEPWGLYVDQHELMSTLADRWPDEFGAIEIAHSPVFGANTARSRRPGRPSGSGSYAEEDAPLLSEMAELLNTGAALSPNAASLMLAARARGGGTIESKARRLRNAYIARQHKGA